MKNVGFAAILLFGSCIVKDDTLQGLNPCGVDDMDTTLPSGCYLDYWLAQDSTVMITWGTPQNGKIGAIESEQWPGWAPHFYKYEFGHFIGLRHSCGSPCWTLTLLPKSKTDTITHLAEDLCVDIKRGYVFGNRCTTEEENDFCLYNVSNGKHNPVTLPGLEWTGDIMTVLDTCAFVDEGLFVRWSSHVDYGSGTGLHDTIVALR